MGNHWESTEFEMLKCNASVAETLTQLWNMHLHAGYNRTPDAIQTKLYKEKFKAVIYIKYLPNREFVNVDIADLIKRVKAFGKPYKEIISDMNIIVDLAFEIKREPKSILNEIIRLSKIFEAHEIASEIANDISSKTPILQIIPPINNIENNKLENILVKTIMECNPQLALNQVQALAITLLKSNELTVKGHNNEVTIAIMTKNTIF